MHPQQREEEEEEEAAAISALPPRLVGSSMDDSGGQAQIFPSAQARNISTHSSRRTLTFPRLVTEVLESFTLTHFHFSLHSCA